MTLFIFEGVDNLGKSTIINKIVNAYKDTRDILMIHATGPKPHESMTSSEVQEITFTQNMTKCRILANTEITHKWAKKNIAFMDRSHFGEYVYGQIYRNANPNDIMDMINKVHMPNLYLDVVVVHLVASPEFVVSHDDNKSFTSNYDSEKRLETVKRELQLFDECFEKSKPEHYMKVCVEGENNNYRNIDDIYNEIIDNISKMKISL